MLYYVGSSTRRPKHKKLGCWTPDNERFFVDYIHTESFEQGGDLSIDLDVIFFGRIF